MFLPKCFPDELLFCRIIRHFIQSGMTSTNYLEWMFGTRKVSIHPVLTCDIENISQYSRENAEKILYQQTLAPLFFIFMPNQAFNLQKSMISGNSSKALRICQYHKFNYESGLSLKYCSLCARDDLRNCGVAYWHRDHQILGVNTCSTHGILLNVKSVAARQRLDESLLPCCNGDIIYSTETEKEFSIFSKDILNYFSNPGTKLDLSIYKSELYSQGYISKNGRVRRNKLMSDFSKYSEQFSSNCSYNFPKDKNDKKYFSTLLSNTANQHPFKYLSLGFWLFRKLDKLLLAKKYKPPKEKTKRAKSHKLIKLDKNIKHSEKTLKITASVKNQIYALAIRGFHRSAIARRFNISTGSVEHEISQHPGLVDHRKRCKFESRRRRYRLQIIRFRRLHPAALRKDIRKAHDSAFIWLYLYDRTWLERSLPQATKPKPKGRVDWKRRDNELSDKVRRLMVKHKGHLNRTKLDKLLGGHGWMIKQRKKLPRTMTVYNDLKK
ncbi:TnsD family Tn7-like transposition protein [Endozoicomonas acroporae]|uniref:TnsD family Tn7-like transposition protein n=1 Tax=Endozoicomonas acroporae TaxID=1701104 RepID=UPI003D78E493